MSSKNIFVFLVIVILFEVVFIGYLIFKPLSSSYSPERLPGATNANNSTTAPPSCPIQTKEMTVEGTSMTPLVKPGEAIKALLGYYACHPIERGDIVLYHYAGDKNPLIKIIKAVPGDHWSLEDKSGRFLILVNGNVLKNSEGNEYQIPDTNKILLLYTNDYPIIPQGAYLILGDETGGSLDSTSFGLVGGSDILGKVILQ
jgi:signal peptidase I